MEFDLPLDEDCRDEEPFRRQLILAIDWMMHLHRWTQMRHFPERNRVISVQCLVAIFVFNFPRSNMISRIQPLKRLTRCKIKRDPTQKALIHHNISISNRRNFLASNWSFGNEMFSPVNAVVTSLRTVWFELTCFLMRNSRGKWVSCDSVKTTWWSKMAIHSKLIAGEWRDCRISRCDNVAIGSLCLRRRDISQDGKWARPGRWGGMFHYCNRCSCSCCKKRQRAM